MKRITYFLAVLVGISSTAFGLTNTTEASTSNMHRFANGYGNSFIFIEDGIEFSVFADGQFDFYMPNYGPNLRLGVNRRGFSFNAGFNYNPYVQYDRFGAIIQIENTPIFYDFYGRVNQIGNIFITYNRFNRINRIGGLNVYYRNNVFWRYDGFINIHNRAYVWQPWHRFYAVPEMNYCVVRANPYRRFYNPIRHIYYRPYRNNVRHFNVGRRGNAQFGRRENTRISDRYVQRPRNNRERNIRTRVERRNNRLATNRAARLNNRGRITQNSNRRGTTINEGRRQRDNNAITRRSTRTDRNQNLGRSGRTQTAKPNISGRNKKISKKHVTRRPSVVSKRVERQNNTRSVSRRKAAKPRSFNKVTPQRKQQSVIKNNRRSTSKPSKNITRRGRRG